jgi:hypothetical protein
MNDNDTQDSWLKTHIDPLFDGSGTKAVRVTNVGEDKGGVLRAIMDSECDDNDLRGLAGVMSAAKFDIDLKTFVYATVIGPFKTDDGIRATDFAVTIRKADVADDDKRDALDAEIVKAITVLHGGGSVLLASDDKEERAFVKAYIGYHMTLHGFHKAGIPVDGLAAHLWEIADNSDMAASIPDVVEDYARLYA